MCGGACSMSRKQPLPPFILSCNLKDHAFFPPPISYDSFPVWGNVDRSNNICCQVFEQALILPYPFLHQHLHHSLQCRMACSYWLSQDLDWILGGILWLHLSWVAQRPEGSPAGLEASPSSHLLLISGLGHVVGGGGGCFLRQLAT